MSQTVTHTANGLERTLPVPQDSAECLVGIPWGRVDVLYTPAYWMAQAWMASLSSPAPCYRMGSTLIEEVVACLLGGYGVQANIAYAAFERVRKSGVLENEAVAEVTIREILAAPMDVGGKMVYYRYWRQKAKYLASAIRVLQSASVREDDPLVFREHLMTITGVGPKIASWITRNWLGAENVAIIDIHIHRAGILSGIFDVDSSPQREYFVLESRYLEFAAALQVSAALLDSVIWSQMRDLGPLALQALESYRH